MQHIFAWVIIVPVGLGLSFLTQKLTKRRIRCLMTGRLAFTPQEFGAHYFFAAQADAAARVHLVLSEYVPVDLARLSPDDRVVQDLGIDRYFGSDLVAFVQDVEQEFGMAIPDSDAEQLLSVREWVSYLAARRG